MAEEESQVVSLHDDFYRDSFGKVIFVISGMVLSIALLAATSLYLLLSKPAPVTFAVDKDWRVLQPVPVDKPYLPAPDLLQWVSNVIPDAFTLDFVSYDSQLKKKQHFFTDEGWRVFLNQLNNYVDYNKLLANKQFVNCVPKGAPFVINQGILSGRYAWWVQIPIEISFASTFRSPATSLTLQVLVVRVPTTNYLMGVAIDNVIVVKDTLRPSAGTGTG